MTEDGWIEGRATDCDPAYALDLPQLTAFIEATQPNWSSRSPCTPPVPLGVSSLPASRARSRGMASSRSSVTESITANTTSTCTIPPLRRATLAPPNCSRPTGFTITRHLHYADCLRRWSRARSQGELPRHVDPDTIAWAVLAPAQGLAAQLLYQPEPEATIHERLNATAVLLR